MARTPNLVCLGLIAVLLGSPVLADKPCDTGGLLAPQYTNPHCKNSGLDCCLNRRGCGSYSFGSCRDGQICYCDK
ncbi:hypothetical protein MAPG_02059 [Magnaporthiopsis poae ATCC 64411]|uniref:Uncharacterized protein n=1 Tax=Magnaporthiopsis poae (strain ATCC 64411 / 73-15) TaxID=644358 RepID=A0A0C4DQC0_MAGP6|nr:hypothetical protein MAPG_02059 [Magnaporthiopsis poae ATCC 64411]